MFTLLGLLPLPGLLLSFLLLPGLLLPQGPRDHFLLDTGCGLLPRWPDLTWQCRHETVQQEEVTTPAEGEGAGWPGLADWWPSGLVAACRQVLSCYLVHLTFLYPVVIYSILIISTLLYYI